MICISSILIMCFVTGIPYSTHTLLLYQIKKEMSLYILGAKDAAPNILDHPADSS